MKKKLLILITLLFGIVFSQNTITGVIMDKDKKEPVPFANVVTIGSKSSCGVQSDFDGKFTLKCSDKIDKIKVTCMGYKPNEINIKKDSTDIIVYLNIDGALINEVIIVDKGDPALILLDSIRANRNKRDYRRASSVESENYEKTKFSIYNVGEKFIQSAFMKTFRELFQNPDTIDKKKFYPILITETYSNQYKKKGSEIRELIQGTKMSGIDNLNFSTLVSTLYSDFNIYDDNQLLLGKTFVGPINPIATSYYKFYLTDTMVIDGQICYKLEMNPKLPKELIYSGHLWVADSTYAIVGASIKMNKEANINLLKAFEAKFVYSPIQNSNYYKLDKEIIRLDINPTDFVSFTMNLGPKNEKFNLSVVKNTSYTNYILDQPASNVFTKLGDVQMADSIGERDTTWWNKHRIDTLTQKEKDIYTNVQKIKEKPFFKFMYKVGDLIGSGYVNLDYVGIGPIYEIYSRNVIEGDRIKIGIRTGDKLSKRFIAEGSIAYGFLDKRVKGQIWLNYHFNKKKNPWRMLGFRARMDIEQLGLSQGQWRPDNILGTFLRRRSLQDLSYINQITLNYEHDWFTGLSNRFTIDWSQVFPTGLINFGIIDPATGQVASYLPSYMRTEFKIETTFQYGLKTITGRVKRRTINGKFPEVYLSYAFGIKGLLSDFSYHTLRFKITDLVRIKPFGYGRYTLWMGKTFGEVPYTMMEIHPGNDTYSFDKNAFNCMNYFEFISDQFISFSYEHHFEGFFFNKIPGFNKLKWREIWGIKAVWGSISEQNRRFMKLPPNSYELRDKLTGKYVPYVEMNVGIENIFNIVRIDFVWRLTHNKQPDPNNPGYLLYPNSFNWGLFATFAFDF